MICHLLKNKVNHYKLKVICFIKIIIIIIISKKGKKEKIIRNSEVSNNFLFYLKLNDNHSGLNIKSRPIINMMIPPIK